MPARKRSKSAKGSARKSTPTVAKKTVKKATKRPVGRTTLQAPSTDPLAVLREVAPQYVVDQLLSTTPPKRAAKDSKSERDTLRQRAAALNIQVDPNDAAVLDSVNRINPKARVPVSALPVDVRESLEAVKPQTRRFHGSKFSLAYFPFSRLVSSCTDRFGYMSSDVVRKKTRLDLNAKTRGLMDTLGAMMGNAGRELAGDSPIPAGFTYIGQFIDHDITLDVSSSLEVATDAGNVLNMRTPVLDLDSLYGRGPALDPFLYVFPTTGNPTAIRFQLGTNQNTGPGGPAGAAGSPAGMQIKTDFDVPRMHNPLNPAASTNTAIIGDPRNDENLIVTQFHHAMLRFHNEVVQSLLLANFDGDIFVEAKRRVIHHYQWAVVNDFLERVCGKSTVDAALLNVVAPIGSAFRMPVEFAVAAYRFGHSMIRDNYWVNFNFINATLGQVFQFNRNPNLPVLSNWVVDFNAFLETGFVVPVNNKARKIDSVLANGLESLPGFSGMMAELASRNLRRGLALGLPSGQGMAQSLGITPLTAAQLTTGLPADEVAILQSQGGLLLKKTPLWYYVLREAMVLQGGDQLGPLGGRIVAETFVRMLKRDAMSYLNTSPAFVPNLPSATPGDFTFADLVRVAKVVV